MLWKYWGKAQGGANNGENSCHPFVYHSLDVVAVASAWLARSQPLGRSLGGANSETARHSLAWVLFFLGLHDLGKLDVRFQAKAPEAIRALKTYHPYPEFLWLKIPTRNY